MNRVISVFVGLLIGLVVAFAASNIGGNGPAPERLTGTLVDPPAAVGDFTLYGDEGPVSLSDFAGKWVILFFGYTSCPDICPFTMVNLDRGMAEIGPAAASQVQVLFVTVDPQRDSPRRVAEYARQFNPRFVGLGGSMDQLAVVEEQFGVVAEEGQAVGESGYLMDHTASLRVLDPRGRVRLIWPFDISGQAVARDLTELMN